MLPRSWRSFTTLSFPRLTIVFCVFLSLWDVFRGSGQLITVFSSSKVYMSQNDSHSQVNHDFRSESISQSYSAVAWLLLATIIQHSNKHNEMLFYMLYDIASSNETIRVIEELKGLKYVIFILTLVNPWANPQRITLSLLFTTLCHCLHHHSHSHCHHYSLVTCCPCEAHNCSHLCCCHFHLTYH